MIYPSKIFFILIGIFLISCPIIAWLIDRPFDLYMCVIKGPFPFSILGSSVLHLAWAAGMFFLGAFFIVWWVLLRKEK